MAETLTSEQWHEGKDRWAQLLKLATEAIFGPVADVEFARASDAWRAWTIMHADALLACSRPKCWLCEGDGRIESETHYDEWVPCHVCVGHEGYAP